MIDYILFTVGFLGLLVGTITDFQKREVADWVNYGLIFAGLGLRLLYSSQSGDWWFFLIALGLVLVLYLVGEFMFRTGQWGGGDTKMLMGLGAIFATFTPLFGLNPQVMDVVSSFFNLNLGYNLSFFLHFFINILFAGGIYGLVWTIILVFINYKKFKKVFLKEVKKNKKKLILFTNISIAGMALSFFTTPIFILTILVLCLIILILPWLYLFTRAVESTSMIRMMKIEDLTEGEWIVEDVKIDKKVICGPKDLGIKYSQIKELKKLQKEGKIDAVKVKIGIPFVPAFLIAFIMTLTMGNVFLLALPL